jgi:hypothetical protein
MTKFEIWIEMLKQVQHDKMVAVEIVILNLVQDLMVILLGFDGY